MCVVVLHVWYFKLARKHRQKTKEKRDRYNVFVKQGFYTFFPDMQAWQQLRFKRCTKYKDKVCIRNLGKINLVVMPRIWPWANFLYWPSCLKKYKSMQKWSKMTWKQSSRLVQPVSLTHPALALPGLRNAVLVGEKMSRSD